MKYLRSAATAAIAAFLASSSLLRAEPAQQTLLKKTLEDFSGAAWKPAQWNKAGGEVSSDDTRAPDASEGKSQRFTIRFSGEGFENFSASPDAPIYVPGNAQKLTFRLKRSDRRHPISISFMDGWGRGQVDGKYLSGDLRLNEDAEWQTVTFDVPKEWVRPVAVTGITTHNFAAPDEKSTITIHADDIEFEADIQEVDLATGKLTTWTAEPNPPDKTKALKESPGAPLIQVSVSTPESCNVFAGDSEPRVVVQVQNWKPGAMQGKAAFSVREGSKVLKTWEESFSVESLAALRYPVPAPRFALYEIDAAITLSDGTKLDKKLALARVPAQPELTMEQKLISPYGMNYHGGTLRLFEAFKKAGIYWFRDYAFGLEMMRLAKGKDRRYAGWPFYPSILQDYDRLGLMVLPVLHAISEPELKDGKPVKIGPDRRWTLDIADILVTFPSVKYWELDNEYDLPQKGHVYPERSVEWENYKLYHEKFGELVDLLGNGEVTAVEQGRAGIYPELELECVTSGAFDKIGVLNSHDYCGTEPPELSAKNYNRGLEPGQGQGYFFDNLRAVKRAASADGKKREAWLTEFGWDNLVGPAVTAEQQAAYLQRGFLLAIAAGTDKAFWFYNFDAEKPIQIFDSCGLFTFDCQPKLALSAMAGMSYLLPRPVFVGAIDAGPNTAGYVFENDGKLVAGLWTVTGDAGPSVNFEAGQLFDYFGNKLQGRTASLKMAPVYLVGLEKSDALYLQTAYSFVSPYMVEGTAGDPIRAVIGINNNRTTEIRSKIQVNIPSGWSCGTQEQIDVVLAPGEQKEVEVPLTIGADEKLGASSITVAASEDGRVVKNLVMRVMVERPFLLEASPLEGAPGKATVNVDITNKSTLPQGGVLRLKLPKSWQAESGELRVEELKADETRTIPVTLVWNAQWQENESAAVEFVPDQNPSAALSAPIIPSQFRLAKAGSVKIDGNVGDWKANAQVPAWMLGSTAGEGKAKIFLGWAPEGLYGAVEVQDSKGVADDPRTFWAGDALELFISSNPEKTGDTFQKGDHQFWLVPILKENRAYAGRWKVKEEIEATRYDMPEVKSFTKRTEDGYVMEFLLPKEVFDSYSPGPNQALGLNLNLTVRGQVFDREVYWPRKKASGVNLKPATWGRALIGE